jgi:hypothetical protein
VFEQRRLARLARAGQHDGRELTGRLAEDAEAPVALNSPCTATRGRAPNRTWRVSTWIVPPRESLP